MIMKKKGGGLNVWQGEEEGTEEEEEGKIFYAESSYKHWLQQKAENNTKQGMNQVPVCVALIEIVWGDVKCGSSFSSLFLISSYTHLSPSSPPHQKKEEKKKINNNTYLPIFQTTMNSKSLRISAILSPQVKNRKRDE